MSKKLNETINSWLLANGYNSEDLNQHGNNGDTALMKATREGAIDFASNVEVLRMLKNAAN